MQVRMSGRRAGMMVAAAGLAAGLMVSSAAWAQTSAQSTTPTDQATQPNAQGMPPAGPGGGAPGGGAPDESGFRPWAEVSKGFEAVNPPPGQQTFYGLWTRKRDGAMLAELPRGFEGQRHFIALTTPTGNTFAGLQMGDYYVYWRRADNRLMLIEPNLDNRSTGDAESKAGIKDVFTDRVLLDVQILGMGPNGNPVIDMRDLLTARAGALYGGAAAGANARLATLVKAKAFPENVEITYEMPGAGGRLQQFHYSISLIKDNPSYQPRKADERAGYFTTVFRDLGTFKDEEKWVRYINRWQLEKRDPKLKLSPPKEPIIFYIEHTTPVRYRKFVRDGALMWNKAFEKVGILDAIEIRQQDAQTGAYMDLDPEDVRYNFIRWVSNDIGTAIGPSRVHPLTGQILDADVILTDGWIRFFWYEFSDVLPEIAMEGMSPETLAWLDQRPRWDPRIRLADPAQRDLLIAKRARRGVVAWGGHPIGLGDPKLDHEDANRLLGQHPFSGLVGRRSQMNGLCLAAQGKRVDMGMMRMALEMIDAEEFQPYSAPAQDGAGGKKDEGKKDEPKWETLDGIPEWFVGPALAELTAHEVGHTIGLRHNFKASSIYDFNKINSPEIAGVKTWSGSVMDYNASNVVVRDGKLQGDINPRDIGPYDFWVIEFGYGDDPKKTLERVADPLLVYATDEDTTGPDPLARTYDMGANPLDYAKSQIELAKWHRERLLTRFVKDGQSWSRVRRGYTITLGMQTRSVSMMQGFVGGAFVNRDRKGDPNGRPPVVPVPAAQQREALKFIIEQAFRDESFGLTPEIMQKMTTDKWMDAGGFSEGMQDALFPIHDRIGGIQSSVLTMLMNPTKLRRIYDNEFLVPRDQDALTLPEMLRTLTSAVWTELEKGPSGNTSERNPYISSLRRNLQAEHAERLIDLSMPQAGGTEAMKAISNQAMMQLRQISAKIGTIIGEKGENANLDAYSLAHLKQTRMRIEKALEASYTIGGGGMGGFPMFLFGRETPVTVEEADRIERERSMK